MVVVTSQLIRSGKFLVKQFCSLEHRCFISGLTSGSGSSGVLGEVVSCISDFWNKEGKDKTDLLLIHNPANAEVIHTFQDKIQCKIACTVWKGSQGNSLQIPKFKLVSVYPMSLLRTQHFGEDVVRRRLEDEEKLLEEAGSPKGMVILASFVSDKKDVNAYSYLVNRVLVQDDSAGFHRLQHVDWFCLISESNYKVLSGEYNIKELRLHRTFFDYNYCLKMTPEESQEIFHSTGRKMKFEGSEQESDDSSAYFYLVRFTPKQHVLRQLSLEDRRKYKVFNKLIQGNKRLIPTLEQWVPGCGRELINHGYGMADEIFMVPPEKFLQLYKDMIKLPEYEGSALQEALSLRTTEHMDKNWKNRSKILAARALIYKK